MDSKVVRPTCKFPMDHCSSPTMVPTMSFLWLTNHCRPSMWMAGIILHSTMYADEWWMGHCSNVISHLPHVLFVFCTILFDIMIPSSLLLLLLYVVITPQTNIPYLQIFITIRGLYHLLPRYKLCCARISDGSHYQCNASNVNEYGLVANACWARSSNFNGWRYNEVSMRCLDQLNVLDARVAQWFVR